MAKFCMDMWKHKLCPFDCYILQIEMLKQLLVGADCEIHSTNYFSISDSFAFDSIVHKISTISCKMNKQLFWG